jgi:hypothetical protein
MQKKLCDDAAASHVNIVKISFVQAANMQPGYARPAEAAQVVVEMRLNQNRESYLIETNTKAKTII